MDISNWRTRIDELENMIIELLNKRAAYAVEIGKIKKQEGLPVFDASREQEILNRVAEKTRAQNGPLSPESMQRIFQTIMTETRQVEK
ncbi:MAG: chorismate mutase [Hallerella porci]|uniref:chorismate mutase n=1 Tax=Hallerella porci TaxID=1945871 RepID=A0ABX5LP30_9BACT|nr:MULTISPECIES: chorismate mutase [Hallerella]MCI5600174.1 chorismate mutase [Hallerella sp.]MDY3922573.1 chorismate mutase [Hallerella porci]PWL01862.1 chorismate mutase [Hallerella porci]